jgi:uncharacterized protein
METVERKFPSKRFLLCLDEFERLEEIIDATNNRTPLNFFRSMIQKQNQWILLFSGSHHPHEIKPYWSDCLINTRTIRLTYLQESEARQLILEPIENFPQVYEPAAVDEIIRLTRCQPLYVQQLCSDLIDKINQEQRSLVTFADVEAILPTAIEHGSRYLDEFWGNLEAVEQDLLLRLIRQEQPNPADRATLKHLLQIDVLEKCENQNYRFQIPFIQKFIEWEQAID